MSQEIVGPGPIRPMKGSFYVIAMIGLTLGLSMAFLEMLIISFVLRPPAFSSYTFMSASLAVTTTIFFLAYLALWLTLISRIGRLLKLATVPLAASLAAFLMTFYTLILLSLQLPISLTTIVLFKLLLLFALSLLTTIGTYFGVKAIHGSFHRKPACLLGLALPIIIAETTIFAWSVVYRKIGPLKSFHQILVALCCLLLILVTIALLYRLTKRMKPAYCLVPFALIVVLNPIVVSIFIESSGPSGQDFAGIDHRITRVILIIDDTLRADHLSSYNEQAKPTPNIDSLAKDGILFTDAIATAPWTLPSVASIMTGLDPDVHMATGWNTPVSDELSTLAERMRDAGYYTAAIGDNRHCSAAFGLDQGFVEYNFFPKSRIDYTLTGYCLEELFPGRYRPTTTTEELTDHAVEWLESNNEKHFFLWLHYFDPHLPYAPPDEFMVNGSPPRSVGKEFSKLREIRGGHYVPSLEDKYWIKELYDAEVLYVDKNVGMLIDALKRLNIYDESLIIFTSDHGEEFWEHGGFEHGHSLYNELLRVPLIIKLPFSDINQEISTVVSLQRVFATILDLCGIGDAREGRADASLRPLWAGNSRDLDGRPVFSAGALSYGGKESVIVDGLKYVRSLTSDREELYNLIQDPGETVSMETLLPNMAQKAKSILGNHVIVADSLREHLGIRGRQEVELDKESLERLRSLGYIQ